MVVILLMIHVTHNRVLAHLFDQFNVWQLGLSTKVIAFLRWIGWLPDLVLREEAAELLIDA